MIHKQHKRHQKDYAEFTDNICSKRVVKGAMYDYFHSCSGCAWCITTVLRPGPAAQHVVVVLPVVTMLILT